MATQSRIALGRRAIENNHFKSFASDPHRQKYGRDTRDDVHYERDDRSARSDSPPCPAMTLCSSTSASSSTTACDHVTDAGRCHACQNLSDIDSCVYQNSDGDSPRTQSAILHSHPKEERLWTGELTVKRLNYDNGICAEAVLGGLSAKKSLPVNGLILDFRQKETFNSVQSRIQSNNVPGSGASSGSRQSQVALRRNITLDEISESDVGDDENDEIDEDEEDYEDDENNWSGQNDDLEVRVVEALGHDLPLAAYLIPLLYKVSRSEVSAKVTRTVGPWCREVTKCAPDSGTSGGNHSSTGAAPKTSNVTHNDARKRSRGPNSMSHDHEPDEEDEDDDDEEDDDRDPKRSRNHPNSGGPSPNLRLACPFYKVDPSKYGVQHDAVDSGKKPDYRVCAGPGFKSITRLKEHLKRKHYPVQCERCYHIFDGGPDRAVRARELENHRQLPIPCERGDAALKEGISDAQWASLDSKKKNQGASNIEKWNEIWFILFPKRTCPETPWYDQPLSDKPTLLPSEGCSQFLELCKAILDHKIGQKHIHLDEIMYGRVLNVVQIAFEAWDRTFRSDKVLSSTDSSSGQPTSYVGGSWQQVSQSRPPGTNRRSSHSQAYSLDMVSSPTGSLIAKPGRGRDNRVQGTGQRFMASQPQYDPNIIPSMTSEHPTYPIDIQNSVGHFGGAYTQNHMGTNAEQFFNMDYETPDVGFDNASAAARAAYANPTGGIFPSQTFMDSPDNPSHHNMGGYAQTSWSPQYSGTGHSQHTGGRP